MRVAGATVCDELEGTDVGLVAVAELLGVLVTDGEGRSEAGVVGAAAGLRSPSPVCVLPHTTPAMAATAAAAARGVNQRRRPGRSSSWAAAWREAARMWSRRSEGRTR